MESVPDMNLEYPITERFYLNYGVTGRYVSGPFKDMIEKFHEIDRLTDARELLQDLETPLQYKSLKNATLGVVYWFITISIVSIFYLVYLFVLTEDLEEGLEAQFIYYGLLIGMFSLTYVTYNCMDRKFENELSEHINKLNKGYR